MSAVGVTGDEGNQSKSEWVCEYGEWGDSVWGRWCAEDRLALGEQEHQMDWNGGLGWILRS